jgi:hypothetical protein
MPVYRWNDCEVYRKLTDLGDANVYPPGFHGISTHRAHYHQQDLAKNPNGYCGIGGCGVPFKIAEVQVGEKA